MLMPVRYRGSRLRGSCVVLEGSGPATTDRPDGTNSALFTALRLAATSGPRTSANELVRARFRGRSVASERWDRWGWVTLGDSPPFSPLHGGTSSRDDRKPLWKAKRPEVEACRPRTGLTLPGLAPRSDGPPNEAEESFWRRKGQGRLLALGQSGHRSAAGVDDPGQSRGLT